MPKSVARFGIAGWQYPDWEGIVYPAEKPRGFLTLELIARLVDAVEINSSYYSPISPNSARKWIKIVQPASGFKFSAKLWQRFTHDKESWGNAEVSIFRHGLEPLLNSGLLGCILCQFPWSFRENKVSFDRLKKIARDFKGWPLAVELRHQSWMKDEIFDWLTQNQIGFANIDQPLFHDSMPPTEIVTSKIGYVRLHGRNCKTWFKKDAETWERYDYLYEKKELEEWNIRVKKIARQTKQLFVIANNHYQGKEVANTLMLKFMYTGKRQKAPNALIAKYSVLKECCAPIEKQAELF